MSGRATECLRCFNQQTRTGNNRGRSGVRPSAETAKIGARNRSLLKDSKGGRSWLTMTSLGEADTGSAGEQPVKE
jgi:hypothetical protein